MNRIDELERLLSQKEILTQQRLKLHILGHLHGFLRRQKEILTQQRLKPALEQLEQ